MKGLLNKQPFFYVLIFGLNKVQINYFRISHKTKKVKPFFKAVFTLLFTFIILHSADAQFYQGSQMSFGKNRVQYTDFYWTFFRFKNYDVYNYVGGKELATYVAEQAQNEMDVMERTLDYRSSSRFQIVIFNKLSDLKQTNIGLELDDQAYNIGGMTKVIGNKVLIYFDGNHQHLQEQIRAGMARALLEQLFYGGNIRERLQASILLNLPQWYTQGLVTYLSKGWTPEDENNLRDYIMTEKKPVLNKLIERDEVFAGQSLWHYIITTYGETSLSNLVYMTRINRSLESGFVFVLGVRLKQLSADWLSYHTKKYQEFEKNKFPIAATPLKVKEKNKIIYQVKTDPFGNRVSYVTNKRGRYKVKITDVKTGKRTCADKGGYVSLTTENDRSFPITAWHPSGKILAIVKEQKGNIILNLFNTETKKSDFSEIMSFSKILNMTYSPDGSKLLMSAVQKGQSDIYVFNVRGRNFDQITNDVYDDLYPQYDITGNKIIFSSNRSNDTLGVDVKQNTPQNNFDLFMADLYNREGNLLRITHSPENETFPVMSDSLRISYLSDKNGVINRFVSEMDSTISFIDTTEHYRYFFRHYALTNSNRNILEQDFSARKNKFTELAVNNGRYRIYLKDNMPFDKSKTFDLSYIAQPVFQPKQENKPKVAETPTRVVTIEPSQKKDSAAIDVGNYVFQSEFKSKKKKEEPIENKSVATDTTKIVQEQVKLQPDSNDVKSTPDSAIFRMPKQRNYDISFSSDYILTQLDNSLFNTTYQPYTGGAVYFDPGMNALFKIGMSDLMNDYKISGAFRIGFDFNSNEYMLMIESLKKRIDKQILFSRQSKLFSVSDLDVLRTHTYNLKYSGKYPFSEISAVKGTIDARMDKTIYVATEKAQLEKSDITNYWASIKGEYIFDNTINKALNLYNGTRFKIFAEVFRKINKPEKMVYIIGADFRHYIKVHRQIIWANRLSASTSLGKQKLIYYLGSQDNVIVPGNNFNNEISVDKNEEYVFQTLASPMRGFKQNIRNGSSFALFNSELRIPVFQYLLNRPIRSDLIRNFQAVVFFDAGTAWSGTSPFSDKNGLNEEVIGGGGSNPVTVTVIKQIQPVVGAYGFGFRSRIFGYFIRADWGFGIDDRQVQKPLFNLALGLDF